MSISSNQAKRHFEETPFTRNMRPRLGDISNTIDTEEAIINNYAEKVVAGYLNLGEKDGWNDGGYDHVGRSFAVLSLKRFASVNFYKNDLENQIVDQSQKIFQTNTLFNFHFLSFDPNAYSLRGRRCVLDTQVCGTQDHTISRVIGNLASQHDPLKPFFEILINSIKIRDNLACRPFKITIFHNKAALDKRGEELSKLKDKHYNPIVHDLFYSNLLVKPEEFLNQHQQKMGPNSTRLLKALTFLDGQSLNAQKVGNCWIKQPMRCQLVSLYLEIISNTALSEEDSWKKSISMYKDLQKHTNPFIKSLLAHLVTTSEMKESALKALAANETK